MERLDEIKEALSTVRLEAVAVELGLSYWTLLRYRKGIVKNPPADVYLTLVAWLDKQ